MITNADIIILREFFERLYNNEIDIDEALSKLDDYIIAQRKDSQTKYNENSKYNEN